MYELIKINSNDYYIDSPSKSGIVKISDSEVVLIDTGNNKGAAKKIKKAIDAEGWTLFAIYLTHSHADHIGGAKFLSEAYGCKVYAKGIERDFTEHTELEGAFLYGALAPSELRSKFLLADPCDTEKLTESNIHPSLTMVELPGHSFDMVGFITKDKTFYVADALSSEQTLDKYKVGYLYDVGKYIETLDMLTKADSKAFVPAHAPVCEDIAPLAEYNKSTTLEICEKITDICSEPLCFEEILKRVFDTYGLTMSFEQYALVGSAIRSYLTYLKENGKIEAKIENNTLLWKKIRGEML